MTPATAKAWKLLVRTVWRGDLNTDPGGDVLDRALRIAHHNDVAPAFVDAHRDRLEPEAAAIDTAVTAYRTNLQMASRLLDDAGVPAILIKALPWEPYIYSNFDVVVGDDGWDPAVETLEAWAPRRSAHPLERTKLLLYPSEGPAVHLHRSVAWFDVPIISTPELRARAVRRAASPIRLPDCPDALRILLAHALFQNLSLSLGDLLEFRSLVADGCEPDARRRAIREGWVRAFDLGTRTARKIIARLDAFVPVDLPVALPILGSALTGVEHALHLATSGRRVLGVRELALRGPLVVAKRRAVARSHVS